MTTKENTLKPKQDSLYYEWNKNTDRLDVLWILETEDKYYEKTKSINVRAIMP